MKQLLVLALLMLIGCKKGDGLIVVSVGATPTVIDVASLHVITKVGTTTHTHDVSNLPSTTIGNASDTTFGIEASADIGSTISIEVDAVDSMSNTVASGSQNDIPLTGGKRTDVIIALVGHSQPTVDMGDVDGGRVCVFDDPASTFDDCIFEN